MLISFTILLACIAGLVKSQSLLYIVKYFVALRMAFHEIMALVGFMMFLVMISQLWSGTMLCFSLVPESMYMPLASEEEDCENMYTDDFFWLHESGVDYLVMLLFIHLLRKMFLMAPMGVEQETAWKTGAFMFLLIQIVMFLGLVLCCTHLSDMTITIAANAFNTFCLFMGKLNWLMFTDQSLNVDTLMSLAYLHYTLAFMLLIVAVYHGVDMHYDWKVESSFTGMKQELVWYDEALVNEASSSFDFFVFGGLICLMLYSEPEALSYEIFMWGDIGMSVDVRFLGVAPHWYFSPYMAWLVVCPYHYTGIIGLVVFFVSFYYQPNIIGWSDMGSYGNAISAFLLDILYSFSDNLKKSLMGVISTSSESDEFYSMTYVLFILALWYAFSYLPYGSFFNSLGGNPANLVAYAYMFLYLGTSVLRVSYLNQLKQAVSN